MDDPRYNIIPDGEGAYRYRYRPNNRRTIDEIKNGEIFFPSRTQLNDPFDFFPSMVSVIDDPYYLRKWMLRDLKGPKKQRQKVVQDQLGLKKRLIEIINREKEKVFDEVGIASFSERPVNLMLWSHYANWHQGICLQFNWRLDRELFDPLIKVKYCETMPRLTYNPAFKDGNKITEALTTKSNVWERENEWRVIKPKKGLYKFNRECLTAIFLGLKCSEEYKAKVIEATEVYPDIRVYYSLPHNTEFGMRFGLT